MIREFKTPKEVADFFSLYSDGYDPVIFRRMLLEAVEQVIKHNIEPTCEHGLDYKICSNPVCKLKWAVWGSRCRVEFEL